MKNEKLIVNNEEYNVVGAGLVSAQRKTNIQNANVVGVDALIDPKKNNHAITLIALIITIIILLILAAVTINVLIGDSGLFKLTKEAGEDYKQAGAREKLEAVLVELQGDKITKPEYNERDYIDNKLKQNNMEVEGDIVTVDGYQFEIDRSVPEIAQSLGKETEFTKDTRGKAKFVYDNETQNVAKVDVTIEIDASISGYTVQYNVVENSDTSTNWVDYTVGSTIEVRKNITIYGRVINKTTGEIGSKFSTKITTIDKIPPQLATITFDKEQAKVDETIEATITQSDLETGIDIEKCKYIIDKNKDKLGENNEAWNNAQNFNENPKNISITESNPGTYYLHILSIDIAGNKIETVSKGIKFVGTVTFLNTDSNFNVDSWVLVAGNNKGRLECNKGTPLRSVRYFSKLKVSDFTSFTFSFGGFGVSPGEAKLFFGLYRDENLIDAIIEDSVLNNEVRPLILDMKNVEDGEYFLGVSYKWISNRDWYSIVTGTYRIVGLGK